MSIIIGIMIFLGIGFLFQKKENQTINTLSMHNDNLEQYEISPLSVVQKIESKDQVIILDVRTKEEYEDVHVQGALLLPVQELSQASLSQIGLGEEKKDEEIIIYCRSGARSKTAYDMMKSLGYTNVKSVAGGILHWQEDKYPFLESGMNDLNFSPVGTQSGGEGGPRIVLDRSSHDFGKVRQFGGTVETTFTITNTGTENLVIGDITTSCSCTTASVAETTIPQKGQTTLTVVFNPNLHEEPSDVFKRTVFVKTNDMVLQEAEITITVDIIEGE